MADRTIAPEAEVPLSPLSTLGVGGSARWFVRAKSVADIEAAHSWCHQRGVDMFVLGGGSNLVIADAGFNGLVLYVGVSGVAFEEDGEGTLVRAGAGEPWDAVVAAAVSRRLSGIECLSGIPGSVGGTPIQNVGAYGQEVSDCIEFVSVFDRRTGTSGRLRGAECGFAYRTSRFKHPDVNRFVVADVAFRLRSVPPAVTYADVAAELPTGGNPSHTDVRNAVLRIRRRKGMVLDDTDPDTRSVGSFFVNPVVTASVYERLAASAPPDARPPGFRLQDGQVKVPAAWLIERAGFNKGYACGRAGLSSKHPLAIVNRGQATARDVIDLALSIKRAVAERFGIVLRPEPIFVGFTNDPAVDALRREH